ncbi:MAG: ABC transporter permease [Cytophagales bacterium]|jgi:predicted permease|nr:ABC transporter permease [Cytophagales bacterium]
MLRNCLKIAWRNLRKGKLYTLINITGLALGMATAVLLMLWVQNEMSYDTYHRQAKNIYRLVAHIKINDTETWHWASTPLRFADYLKANAPEVQQATRLNVPYGDFFTVKVGNELFSEKNFAFVDANWFEVFDYPFVKGNAKDFARDKFGIVLTESRAKQFFGEDDPIGKIVSHDTVNFVVRAVLKDNPSHSSFQFQVLAQNEARLANPSIRENESLWENFPYQTFVVCKEGLDVKQTSDKFSKLLSKARNAKEDETALELQPLAAVHMDATVQADGLPPSGDKPALYIFSMVALFILLIACINYVNLTTARANQRGKEVSVKKIIGASNRTLFGQFFTESAITSLLATALATVLIVYGLPLLNSLADNHFLLTNPTIWLILGGVTLFSIMLTGIYPSVLLASLQPVKLLKGTSVVGVKNATFRKGLVVFQFSFTIVLLIATFLIFKQLKFIQNKQLGYDKEHIYTLTIPWNIKNNEAVHQTLLQKLSAESSIVSVTASSMNIVDMQSTQSGSLNWEGKKPDWDPVYHKMSVGSDFQDMFKLKLTEGRWFNETNTDDENHVILNETAVKEFQIPQPAVGRRFELAGRKGQIIGVVKNFHFKSLHEKIAPMVIFRGNNWESTIYVKAAPSQFPKAIAVTEKVWRELIPSLEFKYDFLDDTYAKLHAKEQKQLLMFNVFAGVVLLISCFGLFALATFAAEQRIKEIGIRKVLGASVYQIVALLSKDFLKLVLVAFVIAIPVGYYVMHQWLQNFAYRIDIAWWMFALIGFLVLLVALVTVCYQAVRAALSNPVDSLRSE